MKRLAYVLIALNIFIIVAGGFLTPLWSKFVLSIGGDTRTAGTAICIFSIMIGIFIIIAAKIENNFHIEKSSLIISAVIMSIGYGGYLLVKSPVELYMAQTVLGLGGALQCPAIYALYQRTLKNGQETLGWGVWNGFYNIAIGVSALVSAELAHYFSLHQVFYFLLSISLVALLLSIIIVLQLRDGKGEQSCHTF